MSGSRVAGFAASAIVTLWGGILVIAAIERRLPEPQRWLGHAAVHIWTVIISAVICMAAVGALRAGRLQAGPLRPLVGTAAVLAGIAVIAGGLDAVGAYPAFRSFHDAVNTVAAPTGWTLLVVLVVTVVAGLADRRPAPDST